MLTADDRWAIVETISLHGHLFDEGRLDRLDELFTADVVYDVAEMGWGRLVGIDAVRDAALTLGERNPLTHAVTNIVITGSDAAGGTATAQCTMIGVMGDGTCRTVTVFDTVRRETGGWRIAQRVLRARRAPLGGLTSPAGADDRAGR